MEKIKLPIFFLQQFIRQKIKLTERKIIQTQKTKT